LLLQLWKLAIDGPEIIPTLWDAGHDVEDDRELLDVYFGQGMRAAWGRETRILVDGQRVSLAHLRNNRKPYRPGTVFFIPAHRALLLAEGWPAPLLRLGADTPVVARLFSQNLHDLFGNPKDYGPLFPQERRLKRAYRDVIDDAIFHGAQVRVNKAELKRRLELQFGEARLPFMAWTAGQREFTPLMLGLYFLLPPSHKPKQSEVDWVVIEEPEMGLHPQATSVVMLLVLELLWRGYKVVLSTHAPLVLDVMFALTQLGKSGVPHKEAVLSRAFGVPNDQSTWPVMHEALRSTYRTFALTFRGTSVESRDISGLDPSSPDPVEAEWGGLTGFSSRFNAVVSEAVNAA
jgi:hypothetical protein